MATYTYSGPVDLIEVRMGNRTVAGATVPDWREIQLTPGEDVDLPDDNTLVAGMVAAGHLKPAKAAPKSNTGKSKTAASNDGEDA
ncbi:hypothetical protein AN189_13090 [Loktanella sp. 3ANDIMAR09]|uniref:hypothetical protein n=1 Tax=Loktanella sp. 3ANDIMAR09 TaxID=1225657 RepID=UPI0006FEF71F|nr:hypothetical protein [Loktanella sp. 3ANDIMAR09]KQI67998.1 hypothetical protein AN189_13090 [Loktanella sp. 3ANDIMAR09]